ncbi:hypothetical protein SAMN05216228_1001112 [Rhizobium tibeticum]|uniref:Uncharacterized protein n=1 Tax=Rhizobium tibeticum TaxID=501024 RepID=A0A1H8CE15_9HYPH|nr:hypothetical protein RTCCBAU85039_0560 [Rhizobium tibeticum]SEM93250.1 hypothetical protein SAMN05216228_1001112 [Rhizobium tibeticum]
MSLHGMVVAAADAEAADQVQELVASLASGSAEAVVSSAIAAFCWIAASSWVHRGRDRTQRRVLCGGAVGDLGNDLVGRLDLIGDALQRLARFADQPDAVIDLTGRASDLILEALMPTPR